MNRDALRVAAVEAAYGPSVGVSRHGLEAFRPLAGCGTYARYSAGCRCPRCSDAKRAYERERRAKKKASVG